MVIIQDMVLERLQLNGVESVLSFAKLEFFSLLKPWGSLGKKVDPGFFCWVSRNLKLPPLL